MEKLIDSDIVKGYLKRVIFGADVRIDAWVDAMPAADAVPVAHGRWIDELCSECGQYVYRGDARNYCPNCGAKMDGERRDEDEAD